MRIALLLLALCLPHQLWADTIQLTGTIEITHWTATAQLTGEGFAADDSLDFGPLSGLQPTGFPGQEVFGNIWLEFPSFTVHGVPYSALQDASGQWVNVLRLHLTTDPIRVPEVVGNSQAAVAVPFQLDGLATHRRAFPVDTDAFGYEVDGAGLITMRFDPHPNANLWTFADATYQLEPLADPIPEPGTLLLLMTGATGLWKRHRHDQFAVAGAASQRSRRNSSSHVSPART